MPTGHSQLQYVPYQDGVSKLKSQSMKLEPDNCYVRIKLHSVQALFKSGWLTKPGILTLFSESRFISNQPTQSLHRVETLKRNIPCQIGLEIYLTDFLPARVTDKLHIQLKYVIMQASPIRDLLTHLEQSKDVTPILSLLSPHAEAALQASKIAGQLLSFIVQEGKQHEILSLNTDLSWANLQPGFYAVIGSSTDEVWPTSLCMDTNNRLVDRLTRQPPANCSYAVFKVEAIERRGHEASREQLWWKLLQSERKEILDELRFGGELSQERQKQFLEKWHWTVSQVRRLAEQEKGCLLKEQDEMIQTASEEVLEKLAPSTRPESAGFEQLPEMWQKLLNVSSLPELKQSVQEYKSALERSQQMLTQLESSPS